MAMCVTRYQRREEKVRIELLDSAGFAYTNSVETGDLRCEVVPRRAGKYRSGGESGSSGLSRAEQN
jgi:hypothetical protein